MYLLTLTLLALCLVSGASAAAAALTKAGGGGATDIKLTCDDTDTPVFEHKGVAKTASDTGIEINGAVLTIKQASIKDYLGEWKCKGAQKTTLSQPKIIYQSKLTGCTWGGKTTLTCKDEEGSSTTYSYKLTGEAVAGQTSATTEVTKEGKYTCKADKDDAESAELEYKASSASRLVTTGGLALSLGLLIANFVF